MRSANSELGLSASRNASGVSSSLPAASCPTLRPQRASEACLRQTALGRLKLGATAAQLERRVGDVERWLERLELHAAAAIELLVRCYHWPHPGASAGIAR
jgi:hypothetical protein